MIDYKTMALKNIKRLVMDCFADFAHGTVWKRWKASLTLLMLTLPFCGLGLLLRSSAGVLQVESVNQMAVKYLAVAMFIPTLFVFFVFVLSVAIGSVFRIFPIKDKTRQKDKR